jgi:radical SAM-linked protein
VQRLRIRYAKRGRLRFTSHRDIQRAFERALRRCAVPMAYSAGFSPHPKVSWANAAPTGAASEAEYVEIAVVEHVDPAELRARMDAALAPGLDVLDVVEVRTADFAARLEASIWQVELPGVEPSVARAAAAKLLACDELLVERLTKNGMRTLDAREPVVRLTVVEAGGSGVPANSIDCAILQVVVRHVTPAVRPDDVLTGLRHVADLAPRLPPRMTRLAQGPLEIVTGTVSDPLAPDRVAASESGQSASGHTVVAASTHMSSPASGG